MSDNALTPASPQGENTPVVPPALAKSLPARLHSPAHQLLSSSGADRAKLFKAFNKTPPQELEFVPEVAGTMTRTAILQASMWQGPLPPPDHLEKFNAIVPGAADRIIRMAEKQRDHRMALESLTVASQHKQSGRGQVFGLSIGFGGILLAAYLAYLGAFTGAASVGTITLGGLAVAFITGKQQEVKSRARKPQPGKGLKPEA